jgi:hypothetical protein
MKKILSFVFIVLALSFNSHAQNILTTVVGTGVLGYTGDGGPATAASMGGAYYVHCARNGNYYFVYEDELRMVDPAGIIHSVAGLDFTIGYTGDGGPASAALVNFPYCVTSDTAGNLYIGDDGNHVIRKINTAGIITTIAGDGVMAYGGDGGPATMASLKDCTGMVTDKHGNLYFADQGSHRIRKIDAAGIITTVAGNGIAGFSGEGGPATAAQLKYPFDVDIDTFGNLYIVDNGNSRIRKVDASGMIMTVAGSTTGGYSGDGGPATLAKLMPVGITVDKAGNLFIADNTNNRVRMVNTVGIITTIAGTGAAGFSDDCNNPLLGQLKWVRKVALDSSGNIYIADAGNFRIRKISRNVTPLIPAGPTQSLHLCKNAPPYSIDSWLGVIDSNTGQALNWAVLTAPAHGAYAGAYSGSAASGLTTPSGLYYTPNTGYQGTDTFRLTVTDCSNKVDTMSILIYVYDTAIGAGTITGVDTVCIGHSITLTDTIAGGIWNATNANATVATGVVTGVTPGTVTIRYILSNTCLSDTATHVVAVKACPNEIINATSTVATLRLWPNPNDGSFSITVSSASDEEAKIIITDIIGKRVKELITNSNRSTHIKLDAPPGLYFVTAQTSNAVWSTKLMVNR